MLIKCKECGAEISNLAKACPHCGFPIKAKSKLSVASLVLGIISIVYGLSFAITRYFSGRVQTGILIPIFIMAILAIIFGGVAIYKTKIKNKSLAGIILGLITIIADLISLLF